MYKIITKVSNIYKLHHTAISSKKIYFYVYLHIVYIVFVTITTVIYRKSTNTSFESLTKIRFYFMGIWMEMESYI